MKGCLRLSPPGSRMSKTEEWMSIAAALAIVVGVVYFLTMRPTADSGPDPNAQPVVVVYRHEIVVGTGVPEILEPTPFFCDGTRLANLENNRAFAIRFEPGKHSCRYEYVSASLDLEVTTGKIYYLRASAGLEEKSKNQWEEVAHDFADPLATYGPEGMINQDFFVGFYTAPYGVKLPMVALQAH